jgi:hypothetical protein
MTITKIYKKGISLSYEYVMRQIDRLVEGGQQLNHIESLIEEAHNLIAEERSALWLYAQARFDYRTMINRPILPEPA